MPVPRLVRPFLFVLVSLPAVFPGELKAQLPAPEPTPTPSVSPSPSLDLFKPKMTSRGMATSSTGSGAVTYVFNLPKDPSAEQLEMLQEMDAGLRAATECYSKNATGIRARVTVEMNPDVPTADGSSNGHIRLGTSCRNQRVCMHEIAHTVGVGTSPQWDKLVVDGVFTGRNATKALREVTKDPKAVLHADRMHFWPYGLNYDSEVKKTPDDFIAHCKIVSGIVRDLKLAH